MKKILFILLGIVLACCSTTNNPNRIFRKKYPNANRYYAVYSPKPYRFQGFKKIKSPYDFTKYTDHNHQMINTIIDSLNFINWESDTVYTILYLPSNCVIWNNHTAYNISWRPIPYIIYCKAEPLKKCMMREDSAKNESNKRFLSAWRQIDTTRIKNIMNSSGILSDPLYLSKYVINKNKIIEYTEYIFGDGMEWRQDTAYYRSINFYTDKDDWHMLGY